MITKEQMLQTLEETDRDLANWPDPMGWLAEKRKVLRAIRALIESSGDKASAQEEGKVTPSGSEIISDADARRLLSDAGYFRTEDNIPAPSPAPINAEISGVDFTQPGAKLVIHPNPRFGFPAPLPKEVEEAMDTLHEAAYDGLCYKYHAKDNVEWWDAVLKAEVVIKTALQRYRELGIEVGD